MREQAALALSRATLDFGIRHIVHEAAGIPIVLGVLGDPSQDALHPGCAAVVANCAEEKQCNADLRADAGLETVLALVRSTDSVVVLRSLTLALARACTDEASRRVIWEPDALAVVVDLLGEEDKTVLANAAQVLAVSVERDASLNDRLGDIDPFTPVVALVASEDAALVSTGLSCVLAFVQHCMVWGEIGGGGTVHGYMWELLGVYSHFNYILFIFFLFFGFCFFGLLPRARDRLATLERR